MKKTKEIPPHPIQPLYVYNDALRFKGNAIVQRLLDITSKDGKDRYSLNEIACDPFTQEDREQFAQLIGYSLSGFAELSYVRDETYKSAEDMANKGTDEKTARILTLEKTLKAVRKHLRALVPEVFRIHPDDLKE